MFSMFSSNTKEFEGKNFYSYSARNSNGEEIDMSTYIGKVALIVNIASQYEEVEPSALNFPTSGLADENFKQLAELDKRYRDQGLVIIGFPTNQFAGQEPAIQEEILSFVHRKYNVDFEIYQKIDVNGPNTHPLFHYLKNVLPGTITNDLKWHFTKFLIDRNGNPVKRYAPNDSPLSFEEEIRHLLRQQSVLVKGMQNLPQGEGAQQGLQPMVGIQKNLQEQQGSTPVWEKERLEKEKPQSSNVGPSGGVGLQAQSLKHEKDLQGKGKLEEKNLEMGGGQGLQYQKSERDAGGKKEEKNLEIGGGKGLQYQKSEKDDWGNKKEEKNLEIGGGKGVQYQKSGKDEWGNREETNLNIGGQGAQGIQYETKPHSTGEGMTLQEQIDLQNQRERELQRDRMLATGQSYAHAAKEKIVDTAQAVKQKVSDTALAVKEGLQNITGIGQTQEAGQPREILRPQKSRPMTLQEIIDQQLQRERDVENDRRLAQQQAASKGVQQKGFMSQQQPLQQQQQFGESSQKQQQQQPGFVSQQQQQQQQPGQGYMQTDLSEEQRAKGFQDQSGLTGEGGTVGAQMGVHLGAHSIQAGVQAGKDPSKTREQSK